VSDEFFC